ncbi:Avr1b-1 avirulence protein [Phytophthora cinnamomi]|uniref:Avr1b-1 avirulence protein n=1 Tax=Phytophthora cinnamomi TaxID=4785 RepID=UPI003559E963|nr:Avr1b-1 avirulence protein [Phytophthora cinnamomi]
MPSSEDARAPNTWTLEEFGDLVTAWELAASRPRDSQAQTLHDAVFKHFVALRGGSTRRNKAALTSKRSALKFSYLFVRDFDAAQRAAAQPSFFALPAARRLELARDWKQQNSSVVELTPAMCQALARIVSKGGDDERAAKDPAKPKDAPRAEPRPTRAARPAAPAKRKPPPAARPISSPWSAQEMMQLIKAWDVAARTVCESAGDAPMSIVHEMFREFELLQGGRNVRNLSGLATRRRVLKQSFSRVAAFDKIQEMNGDPKFTDLPAATRQNLIRSWKNANLLDLSADMYAELGRVIPLDTRAVALEDMRRAKGPNSASARAARKPGRPPKRQRTARTLQDGKEDDEYSSSVFSSQPPSVAGDSEEEKAAIPIMVAQSRAQTDREEKASEPIAQTSYVAEKPAAPIDTGDIRAKQAINTSASGSGDMVITTKPSVGDVHRTTKATVSIAPDAKPTPPPAPSAVQKPSVPVVGQNRNAEKTLPGADGAKKTTPSSASRNPVPARNLAPKLPTISTQEATADKLVVTKSAQDDKKDVAGATALPTNVSKGPGRGKRKRKVNSDGPNGHLWENEELDILIKAWEKAAIMVCNSDPAERLSLNREMYREFVEMQGGSSVRNSTALAARRSSLKFSYAHIHSFNASQKAKGEPSYHEIPEGTRITVLRSWKNRNSVDLTKDMYEGLGRILAMDEKLAEIRSLRPPLPPPQKALKSAKDSAESKSTDNMSKTAKWSIEESSDLIKACADVMNVPSDKEQSATERESLIYDAFVARRQNAGDTDTPIRRDLKSMAQQWRYILASYSYIKACNDSRAEGDSLSWFQMSPVQKRAYQQCTNVPLRFVDLDAEMFALVTETSFVGVVSPAPNLPSPPAKSTPDGISLRPRSTRKRTEAFWSSDSESSMVSANPRHGSKEFTAPVAKKGNNWPAKELWNLIQAWEDASGSSKSGKLTAALDSTFDKFTKLQQGPSNRNRSIHSVRNKMIALKSSFTGISEFISERGDSAAWFDLTPEERLAEIRGWKNKTIMDLNKQMFNALARILHRKTSGAYEKPGKRKGGKPPRSSPVGADTREHDEKGHSGQKPEKYIAANWSKEELLMLGEACGELLEGRRTRRYVFEEEKDRLYRRYEELGGTNSLGAAVGLARFVLDSYEFIYFYDQKAAETNSLSWFELDPADRDPIVARMSRSYRSFNGLTTVDEDIYDVIDAIDAEIRLKLGETKKKTYKPPNDASSSRYVDIEVVVERCTFIKRKHPASTTPIAPEVPTKSEEPTSEADADSSSSESSADGADSDSSAPSVVVRSPAVQQHEDIPMAASPRRAIVRRNSGASRVRAPPSRKRARDIDNYVGSSSTLYITEIIQQQNTKLEAAVKRFRKDSANARKEHHAFLLQKLQDSFPVDSGNGSFLERVAERQGQTLVDIFQRLQEQREAERAKDEELMRQLFGRSGRA